MNTANLRRSSWPDLIVALGIALMNVDAAGQLEPIITSRLRVNWIK
ncbi:hypothetical protein ACLB0R_06630 [Sphingomonas sp. GlSt437]